MIELRKNIPGNYKGYIYCNSLEEANYALKFLKPILDNNLYQQYSISVKRGCSEYALSYPAYKNTNKEILMSYNNNWYLIILNFVIRYL